MITAEEAPNYWTRVHSPLAFDRLYRHTCQAHPTPTAPVCGRPAVYRAELTGPYGPDGPRVVTCWCAEHTTLWRAAEVPLLLVCTLEHH